MNSSSLKHLFFWLAGAGSETLEECPGWEQRKYVAFGATVLVPATFAFIASAYAISTLTENWTVILPVALVWAFIILTIDRALLASYRSYMSPLRKLGQFFLRFVVALLMGLTIAHPLVLLLFRDTISSITEREREAEIVITRDAFGGQKEKMSAGITTIESAIAAQREKWNDSFKAEFLTANQAIDQEKVTPGLTPEQQQRLNEALTTATAPYKERLAGIVAQEQEMGPQYAKIQEELAFWQAEFEKEVNGQRSGIIGLGPRAKSIQADHLAWRREESRRLAGLVEHLTNQRNLVESQIQDAEQAATDEFQTKLVFENEKNREEQIRIAELNRKIQADQAAQFVDQQNLIRTTIKQQIDTLLADLQRAQDELTSVSREEKEKIAAIRAEPRRDILTQTLALHSLFEPQTPTDPSSPAAQNSGEDAKGNFALSTYLILTLLFMLVDTIPLVIKFFCQPGPYDMLVNEQESGFDRHHREFSQMHRQYLKQLANSGRITAPTRSKALGNAFLTGVEHTKTAREFLDHLIQMEQSFCEQMETEAAKMADASEDALKLRAAMKENFYRDLHHRIETFFGKTPETAPKEV